MPSCSARSPANASDPPPRNTAIWPGMARLTGIEVGWASHSGLRTVGKSKFDRANMARVQPNLTRIESNRIASVILLY